MARLTRHELKQDEFRTTFEQFERLVKERYKEILAVAGLAAVIVGSTLGLKIYSERQEGAANARLSAAIRTFRAYVGPQPSGGLLSDADTFPTAREKYKKALEQFTEITRKFPRTTAAAVARYHVGVCQAELGNQAEALKTLQEASRTSDREISSLAKFALANELAKIGKTQEAVKSYQNLADHPTLTVPKAAALLAMADAYRASQPARARQIYEQLQKDRNTDATLAQAIRQQIASLPQ